MAREAIVLTLGGVREVLYGGQGTLAPVQAAAYPAALPRYAINCLKITSYTAPTQKIARYGGVVKPESVGLTAHDRSGALSALFGPLQDALPQNILAVSLDAETGTVSLVVEGSIAGYPDTGYLYIAQETFYYISKDNGTSTFTLHATEGRAALGSLARRHLRDNTPARSFKPVVTQQPVFWAHRKAVLSLHRVLANGTIEPTPIRELIRGSLRADPKPAGVGTWNISIISSLAKWDRHIGSAIESTTLVDHYYYCDGERANSFTFFTVIPEDSITRQGWQQASTITVARPAGAGGVGSVSVNDYGAHQACFGTARGANPGSPAQGPIRIRNRWNAADAEASIPSAYGAAGLITLSEDNGAAVVADDVANNRSQIVNVQVASYIPEQGGCRVSLAAGLHKWPQAAIALVNDAANCTTSPNGQMWYADARLSANGQRLSVVDSGYPFDRRNPVYFGPIRQANSVSNMWYPMFRTLEDDPIDSGVDRYQNRSFPTFSPFNAERYGLPIAVSTAEPEHYTYAPPALSFWQGSKYLLIMDDILPAATPANPQHLRAQRAGTHPGNARDGFATAGEPLVTVLEYEAVEPQLNADGDQIGYRVTLTDATLDAYDRVMRGDGSHGALFGSFGNWNLSDGRREVRISPHAVLQGDPRVLLLQLMLSGSGGVGYPSATYSVLPQTFGLSIDIEAVDVEGIRGFPLPRGFRALEPIRQTQGIEAKKFILGILQSMGAALVMADIGGKRKITLVPARTVNPLLSQGELPDRAWLAEGRPGSGRVDDKQTTWIIKCNWDNDAQTFRATPTYHDGEALDKKGGAQSAPVTIEIRGLYVADDIELIGLFQMLRHRYAKDKRIYSGSVGYASAAALSIGQIVYATVKDGLTPTGAKGVTAEPMQIIELKPNPITRRTEIVLLYDKTKLSGYAPVCTVSAVVSVDVLTVSRDAYSFPADNDLDFFLDDSVLPPGGVPVECVHVGSEENNTTGAITTADLSTNQVTVVGHGLAESDRLRVRDWANTLAYLKNFAHMRGQAAAGLGVENTDPFKYG